MFLSNNLACEENHKETFPDADGNVIKCIKFHKENGFPFSVIWTVDGVDLCHGSKTCVNAGYPTEGTVVVYQNNFCTGT